VLIAESVTETRNISERSDQESTCIMDVQERWSGWVQFVI